MNRQTIEIDFVSAFMPERRQVIVEVIEQPSKRVVATHLSTVAASIDAARRNALLGRSESVARHYGTETRAL